jgi:hemin uptake protein HemP
MLVAATSDPKQAGEASPCVPLPAAGDNRAPVYSSAELLRGCREAWIEHGQQMYRLRLTAADKLYLTK